MMVTAVSRSLGSSVSASLGMTALKRFISARASLLRSPALRTASIMGLEDIRHLRELGDGKLVGLLRVDERGVSREAGAQDERLVLDEAIAPERKTEQRIPVCERMRGAVCEPRPHLRVRAPGEAAGMELVIGRKSEELAERDGCVERRRRKLHHLAVADDRVGFERLEGDLEVVRRRALGSEE